MRSRPIQALRDTPVWRASGGSLFAYEATYVVVNAARAVAFDALALLPPAVLGLWWVGVAPTPAADYDVTPDPLLQFMLRHRMWAVLPVLLALTACAVVLRLGRRSTRRLPSGTAVSVVTRLPLYAAVFTAGLFCLNEFFVPGSLAVRFGPMTVAVLYGWLVRRVIARARLLAATRAGFRPPFRATWSRRARGHLRRCVDLRRGGRTGPPREALDAHAYFVSRGATAAAAWCAARAVDDAVGAGRAADVEFLFPARRTASDGEGEPWRQEPAFQAAHGLFCQATGRYDEVARHLDDAQETLRTRERPVPSALRMLIALERADIPRWPDRTLLRLVLGQRYALVLRHLSARAAGLADTADEEDGLRLARRIANLVTELGEPLFSTELTPVEALDLVAVRAESSAFIGERLLAQRRYREAVEPLTTAGELFQELAQPERAGLWTAWVITACLLRRDARSAVAEDRLLEGLLHSLERVEAPRGRLRDRHNRLGLAKARGDLADAVFTALGTGVVHHSRRAAELALWFMESLNRNALADAIRRGLRHTPEDELRTLLAQLDADERVTVSAERAAQGQTPHPSATDGEQAARRAKIMEIESREMAQALFPGLPDIRRLQSALAGRVALTYRCREDTAGWHIACVMAGPAGVRLHCATLPVPPQGAPGGSTPHGLLTMLADTGEGRDDGGTPQAAQVHTEIDFSRPVWHELADVLLPAELGTWLEQSSAPDAPAVLVVVPDGPLALVPFAGLRLAGDRTLAECATTVFVPGLGLLVPPGDRPAGQEVAPRRAGPPARGRVIAHAAAPMFSERLTAFVEGEPLPPPVSEPANRADLREALRTATPDDVAVLFHHGDTAPDSASRGVRLADGGYLSATTARRWNWPGTVVLGSCWAAHLLPAEAQEPFGLPTACLLAGARSVIGGQAPIIASRTVASVIARVVVSSAQGERPAQVLGRALRTLSRTPRVGTGPAAGWANLTCWTTDPPPAARRVVDTWRSWTSHSEDERPDVHGSLRFDVLRKVSRPGATTSRHPAPEPSESFALSPTGTDRPVASAELADWAGRLAAAQSAGRLAAAPGFPHEAGTAGLLAHMAARRDPALDAWAVAGIVVHPARQGDEAREGGVRVEVGNVAPTVSAAVADSLRRATDLAHHLRHREVTSAHVLYCALHRPGTDAAACLAWDLTRPGPRAVLAEKVLNCPDLPLDRLPEAPSPERPADSLDHPAWTPVLMASALSAWLAPKALKTVVGIVVVLLLAATVAQHRSGKAMAADAWLDAAAPRLTAAVQGPGVGRKRPASLIGPLADRYVMPRISGWKAVALETFFGDAKDPDALRGHYLFVTAGADGLSAEHPVRVRYRGAELGGTEHCAGRWSTVFCLVDVRLPDALRPHLTRWAFATAQAGTPTAFLGSGRTGTTSRLGRLYEDDDFVQSTAASDGTAPLMTTPVLTQRRAQEPALLGYVVFVMPDGYGTIVPSEVVAEYAEGLAQRFVGPVDGDQAYAGVGTTGAADGLHVTSVAPGFAADVAGVREGDRITTVDGRPVLTPDDLGAAVARHRPHSTSTLGIVRGAKALTVTIRWGYRPLGS